MEELIQWSIGIQDRSIFQNSHNAMRKARGELTEEEIKEKEIKEFKKQNWSLDKNKHKDWMRVEESIERLCVSCKILKPVEDFGWVSLNKWRKVSVRSDYCSLCVSLDRGERRRDTEIPQWVLEINCTK